MKTCHDFFRLGLTVVFLGGTKFGNNHYLTKPAGRCAFCFIQVETGFNFPIGKKKFPFNSLITITRGPIEILCTTTDIVLSLDN